MRSQRAILFQAQIIGSRLLDDDTLEEARMLRVCSRGIGERELAKSCSVTKPFSTISNA